MSKDSGKSSASNIKKVQTKTCPGQAKFDGQGGIQVFFFFNPYNLLQVHNYIVIPSGFTEQKFHY